MVPLSGSCGQKFFYHAMGALPAMTDQAENLSDQEIGNRHRLAREGAKFKKQEAAEAVKIARTTLAVVELGQRRARLDELQKLATLYKTSANAILRREAVHLDMVPRFRK